MSAGEVTVEIRGKDVSLEALLTRLETRMRQTDATGQQLGDVFGRTIPQAQQKAADAALRHAQALARAAQQMGDSARGAAILRTALIENAGASDRAATAVLTQISSLERGKTLAMQFGDSVKGSLLSIVGPAALAGAAIGALSQLDDLARLGAQAEQTAARFDKAARAAGTTGEAFTQALRAASAGTISDLNLQLAANRARLLGVADSADKLAPLLAIARDRAQEMGISTTQAFNDLVTGLGRGSALILDNLGITVSVTEANKAYAAQLGKNAQALTDAEQKQALINAVLQQGQASLAATGGALDTTSTKLERLSANMENLKARAGALGVNLFAPAIEGAARLTGSYTEQAAAVESLRQSQSGFFGELVAGVPVFGQIVSSGQNAAQTLNLFGISAQQAAAAQQQTAAATQAASAATQRHTAALIGDADASTGLINTYIALSAQLDQDAAKSELASVQSQTLAIRKAELTQQAQLAAGALLASGAAGEAAAGRLAASSSLVDQLTAAFYRLRAAQIAANQADLKALTPAALSKSRDIEIADSVNQKTEARATSLARSKAAAEAARVAELRYQQTLGNYAPAIRRAEDELSRLEAGTAAHFDKLNEIARLKETQASAASKARRGAAGAAKLSDQAKLDNQLLAQQDQANNRLADVEIEHQQRLLDIDREFAKRSLAQQRENEVSKRQSRADFYDNLTSATKDVGQQVAEQLSASYEAAYAKAQEIAQAGNQKLASDYLALKQSQIAAELEFQKRVAEAAKDKDKAEIDRLNRVHQLQAEANAEQEKQLLEGGDANVKAREEALDAESQRFQENQDKIATSADRAADRIVTGAQRAGKAIKDVNVDLAEQDRILNRIGARTGVPSAGAPGAPLAAPAGPTPAGAAPTAGAPIDLAALQAGLDAIRAAIDGMSGAVTAAQRETTGAVRGLSGRLVA